MEMEQSIDDKVDKCLEERIISVFESEYQKAFAWSRGFHMKPYNLNDYKFEKDDDNSSKKKTLLEFNLEDCLNQFSMNCIFMFMESLPKEVRKLAWDMAIKRKFDERILSNDVISDYYDSDGNNLDNIST